MTRYTNQIKILSSVVFLTGALSIGDSILLRGNVNNVVIEILAPWWALLSTFIHAPVLLLLGLSEYGTLQFNIWFFVVNILLFESLYIVKKVLGKKSFIISSVLIAVAWLIVGSFFLYIVMNWSG